MEDARSHGILWRPSTLADLARYTVAAVLVVGMAGAATLAFNRLPDGEIASEADDAVLLDLPPALASSAPASEATGGPEQQATEAATPVARPKEVAPDLEPEGAPPKEETPLAAPEDPPPPTESKSDLALPEPAQVPPPPPNPPQPPAPLETPPDAAAPPPVAAAEAQEEMAPAGSQSPVKDADPIDSEAARRRAARAMSRWQQAMLVRLEQAKGGARSGGEAGTVKVAFTVDRRGRLVSSHVVHSSGSSRLDQVALALLGRAAPFPDPPTGAPGDLSFTVPIAFAHRR